MKERLLIKCDTTIYADEITNLLIENNIVSRQHDEGQDQNPGAYMFSRKIMKKLLR